MSVHELTAVVEELRPLLQAEGVSVSVIELLKDFQPYDLSVLIRELEYREQLRLLEILPPETAAEVLEFFEPDEQYRFLDHLAEENRTEILNCLPSDAVVQLLTAIHPRQAEMLLGFLQEPYQSQVRDLLSYPENTAGSMASVEYVAARQWWSVEGTLAHMRKVVGEAETINYIYVLSARGELAGVLSLRELILAPPSATLADIMNTKIVAVPADLDQEQAARLVAQYDLVALPVVSDTGKMVGILTVDDVLDVIEEEATEDIHLLGGSQPLDTPYLQAGFFSLFRKRIVWLLVLFVAGALTGNILSHFEGLLQQVVALTFFIPLLIGTGGNAGSQTSTLVIRAMAVGDVTARDFFKVIWLEMRLGLVLGAVMAGGAFLRALTLDSSFSLGLTVALAITIVVTVSSSIGAVMPIIGKRLGLDPAVFSAPMITTVADACGLLIYFQIARMVLGLE